MRFWIEDSAPIRPYIVTAEMNRSWLAPHVPTDIRWYDPLQPHHRDYCIALNRANSFAHDGSASPGDAPTALGMPRWVQLDCCLLPAAMVGFETTRASIPEEMAHKLDPSGALPWIAISEYVAAPSVEVGRHTGVSMFSLVRGRGLGVRSKALGLRAVQSSELVGVTQYTSPGVAVHLRFGPLAVVAPSVAVHSRPGETFVYRLDVPQPAVLTELSKGMRTNVSIDIEEDWTVEMRFDPRDETARLRAIAHIQEAPTWIIDAGPVKNGKISALTLGRPR